MKELFLNIIEKFNPYHDELGRFTTKNGSHKSKKQSGKNKKEPNEENVSDKKKKSPTQQQMKAGQDAPWRNFYPKTATRLSENDKSMLRLREVANISNRYGNVINNIIPKGPVYEGYSSKYLSKLSSGDENAYKELDSYKHMVEAATKKYGKNARDERMFVFEHRQEIINDPDFIGQPQKDFKNQLSSCYFIKNYPKYGPCCVVVEYSADWIKTKNKDGREIGYGISHINTGYPVYNYDDHLGNTNKLNALKKSGQIKEIDKTYDISKSNPFYINYDNLSDEEAENALDLILGYKNDDVKKFNPYHDELGRFTSKIGSKGIYDHVNFNEKMPEHVKKSVLEWDKKLSPEERFVCALHKYPITWDFYKYLRGHTKDVADIKNSYRYGYDFEAAKDSMVNQIYDGRKQELDIGDYDKEITNVNGKKIDYAKACELFEKQKKHLNAAIKKFELKEPLKVYRWCDLDQFKSFGEKNGIDVSGMDDIKKLEGCTFTDKSFISTSMSNNFPGLENIYMYIDVPAGKGKGCPVSKGFYEGKDIPLTAWKEYSVPEFVLPQNTKLHFDKIRYDKDDYVWIIEASVEDGIKKFNPYHDELGRFTSKDGNKSLSDWLLVETKIPEHLKESVDEWNEKLTPKERFLCSLHKWQITWDMNRYLRGKTKDISDLDHVSDYGIEYENAYLDGLEVFNEDEISNEIENFRRLKTRDYNEITDVFEENAKTLNGAIEKFELKKPITVYRGVSLNAFSDLADKVNDDIYDGSETDDAYEELIDTDTGFNLEKLEGHILTDKAFMSTSVTWDGIEDCFGNKRVAMEITVPAGKGQGMLVSKESDDQKDIPLTPFSYIPEFVLPTNSSIRLDDILYDKRSNQWVIQATKLDDVKKFNPYHDELGRFTSKNGAFGKKFNTIFNNVSDGDWKELEKKAQNRNIRFNFAEGSEGFEGNNSQKLGRDFTTDDFDFNTVKDTLIGFDWMQKEFPSLKKNNYLFSPEDSGGRVSQNTYMQTGYYRDGNIWWSDNHILFNADHFKKGNYQNYLDSMKDDYHPKNSDSVSMAVHEMAHTLECSKKAEKTMKKSIESITGKKINVMSDKEIMEELGKVSRYAKLNWDEAFAECIADCYANGSKAANLSKEVFKNAKINSEKPCATKEKMFEIVDECKETGEDFYRKIEAYEEKLLQESLPKMLKWIS